MAKLIETTDNLGRPYTINMDLVLYLVPNENSTDDPATLVVINGPAGGSFVIKLGESYASFKAKWQALE